MSLSGMPAAQSASAITWLRRRHGASPASLTFLKSNDKRLTGLCGGCNTCLLACLLPTSHTAHYMLPRTHMCQLHASGLRLALQEKHSPTAFQNCLSDIFSNLTCPASGSKRNSRKTRRKLIVVHVSQEGPAAPAQLPAMLRLPHIEC